MNNAMLSIMIFLSVMLIGSCINSSSQSEFTIYGLDTISNKALEYIELQDFENIHDLHSKIEDIACSNRAAAIQIKRENRKKTVVFGNPCWANYSCILIRSHNVFKIRDDKIIMNDTFSIDEIDGLLAKHYKNFGADPNFSTGPEKAFVTISFIEKEHGDLEELLDNLTLAYDKAGLTDYLNIWIEDNANIPPPPPPPPPILF